MVLWCLRFNSSQQCVLYGKCSLHYLNEQKKIGPRIVQYKFIVTTFPKLHILRALNTLSIYLKRKWIRFMCTSVWNLLNILQQNVLRNRFAASTRKDTTWNPRVMILCPNTTTKSHYHYKIHSTSCWNLAAVCCHVVQAHRHRSVSVVMTVNIA